MSETILYGKKATAVAGAVADGDDLWLAPGDLRRASGWELKPEGACLSDVCVPLTGERAGFVRGAGGAMRFNLAALARLLDMPSLHDAGTGTWCFGESAASRARRVLSPEAPDFTLPDLAGKPHSLSDYRGQKIFMVAWASW
jgi:hypothetical protein